MAISVRSRSVGQMVYLLAGAFALGGCGNRVRYTCPAPYHNTPKNGYATLTGGTAIRPSGDSYEGSLGVIVADRATGRPMALTAAHVVYGSERSSDPFPVGKVMNVGLDHFGTAERGLWIGGQGLVSPPDFAAVSLENQNFAYNAEVKGIGAIGGMGTPVVGQRVKLYNNQPPLKPSDPPVGVVYGTITTLGPGEFQIKNVQPGMSFGVEGDSGSVVVEDESGNNLVVGLYYAGNNLTLMGIAQPISYVLDRSVNPDAVDATLYDPNKNPVPLFRYVDKQDGSRMYTTDWLELAFEGQLLGRDKTFEGRSDGAVFKNPMTYSGIEMIPLFRFYNQDTNDTIYTTDAAEIEALQSDSAWCNLDRTGYLPPVEIPNKTTKLLRFFNAGLNQHRYTTDPDELDPAAGWMPEGFYWVFARYGEPDPPAITGPSDARIAIDPSCSTLSLAGAAQAQVSGTVDLTIEPGCAGPTCGLTIAALHLDVSDSNLFGHAVTQARFDTDGYTVGRWQSDGSFVLPDLSTTATATFALDGVPSALTLTNVASSLTGQLSRDYSSFTLSGDFADGSSSLHLALCGQAVARPPVAVLTSPGAFECDSPSGADVTFSSAQSSDPDGDIEHRIWRLDNRTEGTDVVTLTAPLSPGSHAVSVAVSDSRGATSTAAETVEVVDTTPPALSVAVSPDCLFPPNHKYVLFTLGDALKVHATDTCDPAPAVRIVDVTSNQPSAGGARGGAAADFAFGSGALCVRAENNRSATTPREYTVTLEATDHAGNTTRQEVTISVPHSLRGGERCDVRPDLVVADDDPRCVAAAP